MDPSDEQHDDDLFADLYGDDEPKSAPEPPKAAPAVVAAVAPTKQAAPNVAVPNVAVPNAAVPNVAVPNVAAPEPSLSVSAMTNNSVPTAAPPKAVDPRAPQPPTEIQTDETFEDDQQYDQSHAYSGWDASNMAPQQQQEQQQNQQQGHGGGESQGQGGYDHQPGSNSYGDHGNTGSPAIKEDGCVFAISFLPG